MYLLQLKYFLTVAQYQHVTLAAEKLGISQSALSNTITKLETEIGVPLLKRNGRKISLNAYGEKLAYHSKIILNEIQDIQYEFAEIKQEDIPAHPISIGVSDSNFHGHNGWLFDLLENKPDLKMKITQMSSEEIREKLLTSELDLGLSFALRPHAQIATELLVNQPYLLAVSHRHPLAQQEYILTKDLITQSFIALTPSHSERLLDSLSAELHFEPDIIFEGNSETMGEILSMGIGVILTYQTNPHQWVTPLEPEVKLLPIPDLKQRYQIFLSWNKERYLPQKTLSLIAFMKEQYQTSLQQSS